MAIERDDELLVWHTSPEGARKFAGVADDAPVRVVKDGPQTRAELSSEYFHTKLYAVTIPPKNNA